MDEKFDKLPRWARDEITRLRSNLASAHERIEATLVPPEPDRPAYDDYDDRRGLGLPCRQVRFAQWGISIRAGQHGVEIHGDGQLLIKPNVTNVLTLTSDRVHDH